MTHPDNQHEPSMQRWFEGRDEEGRLPPPAHRERLPVKERLSTTWLAILVWLGVFVAVAVVVAANGQRFPVIPTVILVAVAIGGVWGITTGAQTSVRQAIPVPTPADVGQRRAQNPRHAGARTSPS